MADRTRDINYFYPTAESTGYSPELTEKRFSVLRQLSFESVLDVGSGKCNLHDWLKNNDIDVKYDAVDIREDALALCNCQTYTTIPNKTYDLVCLFGTVTFNIDENKQKNKNILLSLLQQSSSVATKYLVVTVMKQEILKGLASINMIGYTKEEIQSIGKQFGSYKILDDVDPSEYILICEINNNGKTNT